MELLLKRKMKRGVTRYLVRWRGHTSAADECLRAEELLHCPEKVPKSPRRALLPALSAPVTSTRRSPLPLPP